MIRLVTLALLVLSLSACGAVETGTPDDSTGTAPSTPAASAAASAEASQPAASEPAGSAAATGVEAQAVNFLATQLNQSADALTLQSKEQVDWNDGSLGCPQPGMMYTQAIVPGYKLTFTGDGQTYELHTDESGQQVVWCEGGQPKEIGQP